MTITLVGPIREDQAIILVTAPEEMALDKIYQVDQELIILRSAPRSSRVSVGRGMFGSARATHAGGSALTPVSLVAQTGLPVSPPGPGGGSGGVTVDNGSDPPAAVTTLVAPGAVLADGSATLPLSFQLLGPYRINFDDPDAVSDDGKALVALPDGALLIRAWPIIRTTWDGTFTDALLIVQLSDDPVTTSASVTSGYDLTDREFPEADPWAVSPEWDHTGIDYTFHDARLGVAQHGASFNVRVFIAGGSATAGAADVYAIIAVPTS